MSAHATCIPAVSPSKDCYLIKITDNRFGDISEMVKNEGLVAHRIGVRGVFSQSFSQNDETPGVLHVTLYLSQLGVLEDLIPIRRP